MGRILRHCGCGMEYAFLHILSDIRPILLRDRKVDIDRIRLIDDDDRHIDGLDEIPGFQHYCAGTAVNWRVDRAIAQLQPGASERVLVNDKNGTDVVDRGPVRANGFLQSICLCANLLRATRCDHAALLKCRVPLRLRSGILQLSNLPSEVGFRLFQLGLILFDVGLHCRYLTPGYPRINGEEQLTFPDEIAFVEMNLEEFTGNLSLYRHSRNWLDIADGSDFHRHQLLRNLCDDNRNAVRGRRCGRIRCTTPNR